MDLHSHTFFLVICVKVRHLLYSPPHHAAFTSILVHVLFRPHSRSRGTAGERRWKTARKTLPGMEEEKVKRRPPVWRPKLWSGHNWTAVEGRLLSCALRLGGLLGGLPFAFAQGWKLEFSSHLCLFEGVPRCRLLLRTTEDAAAFAANSCESWSKGRRRQTNKDNGRLLPQPEPRYCTVSNGIACLR